MKNNSRGFIALMSAVIISAVLMSVAITGSLTGFLERGNNVNAELKDRSNAAADACADLGLLLVTNNAAYTGTTLYTLNSLDACRVVVSGQGPKTIRVQATSSNAAVTNLTISYSTTTAAVLSWQEVPVF